MQLGTRFNKLCEEIPDIEEHITNGNVKVIKVRENSKIPSENDYYKAPSRLEDLKEHNGNFGLIVGYNHNEKSLAVIDIDGYKMAVDKDNEEEVKRQAEIKQATKEYLFQVLKEIPNSLIVKTQSNGYHIILWNRTVANNIHETSKALSFPSDFPIAELRNQPLKDSIEIFTKEGSKQCVLPSSYILDKATNEKRTYKVISDINKLSDIDTVDDINKTVQELFIKHGYKFSENKSSDNGAAKKNPRSKFRYNIESERQKTLKKLKASEVKAIVEATVPIYTATEGAKHTTTLYLGGFLSEHITKKSANKIANGIVKKIGSIFDSTAEFKKTLLVSYDRKVKEKAGLPKLCEHILDHDKTFNISAFSDTLNKICNDKFTKEIVGDIYINENQVPIVLYEDDLNKWLKYEGIFQGIDLILNPTAKIGSFRYSETEKTIIIFEFKFKNKFFDIKKKDLEAISDLLHRNTDGKVKLPTFFKEEINTSLSNLPAHATNRKELSSEVELKQLFQKRNKVDYARKQLGIYLNEHGVILRKRFNTPYIYNNNTNGFDSIEIDDIVEILNTNNDFELNSISTDDIKTALTFIGDRRTPTYNIVKFKNCLYNMETFQVITDNEEPILTLTEVQFNYNPAAKGDLIINFLKTSLAKPYDNEEMIEERVQGFLEFIGYILTSGNFLNAWFIFSGIGGAGKGLATNLITKIFGSEKVGGLQLQELTPDNRFATSHLLNKQINIVRDSPKKPIEDTGMLKSITGYDDIPIEPKGKDKVILPKEEVPDFLTVCNNIPVFKDGFEEATVQRVVLFEFLNLFRGTDKQDAKLEDKILANDSEMEWLLYNGIEAYKKMIEEGRDFKARVSETKTRELLGKHTDPIAYIIPKLVRYTDMDLTSTEDYIKTDELNKLIIFVAQKEGLNISNLDKKGRINSKTLLNEIRLEFDLDKHYTTDTTKEKYYTNEKGRKVEKFKTVRIYPYLYKTAEYNGFLNDMIKKETEDKQKD